MQAFSQNLNDSGTVEVSDDAFVISTHAKTDWFFHPTGKFQQSNVPSLFIETADPVITLTAQVSVDFASTYDAGALFVQTAADQWAKLAYELSPQAIPTIVSVVTRQTSDDCDGPRVPGDTVWLRIHVRDNIVGFHFSEDGKFWRFMRTFALARSPGLPIKLGLAAQAPRGDGCRAVFRAVAVARDPIPDFRNGE